MKWGFSEWVNEKTKCGKRKLEERIEEWWKSKEAEKRKYIEGEIRMHEYVPGWGNGENKNRKTERGNGSLLRGELGCRNM